MIVDNRNKTSHKNVTKSCTLLENMTSSLKKALQKKHGPLGRAQFLALKPEIDEALKDKWEIKKIWQVLNEQKRFTHGYHNFIRIFKEYKTESFLSVHSPTKKKEPRKAQSTIESSSEFTAKPLPDEELF